MAFQCNENTAALMASYIVQVATSWFWQLHRHIYNYCRYRHTCIVHTYIWVHIQHLCQRKIRQRKQGWVWGSTSPSSSSSSLPSSPSSPSPPSSPSSSSSGWVWWLCWGGLPWPHLPFHFQVCPRTGMSRKKCATKRWLLIVMWGSIINLLLAFTSKTNDKWKITCQDAELERRICDNHKKHTGQSPAEVNHLFKSSFFIIILQRKIIFLNQFLAWFSLTTTYTPHHQPPHTHLIFIFSQPVKK